MWLSAPLSCSISTSAVPARRIWPRITFRDYSSSCLLTSGLLPGRLDRPHDGAATFEIEHHLSSRSVISEAKTAGAGAEQLQPLLSLGSQQSGKHMHAINKCSNVTDGKTFQHGELREP